MSRRHRPTSFMVVSTTAGFIILNSCGSDPQLAASPPPDASSNDVDEAGVDDAGGEVGPDASICDELVAFGRAKGCPERVAPEKCRRLTGCPTLELAAVSAVYRCWMDSPDFCNAGADDECALQVANSRRDTTPAFATYNSRCLERETECRDGGFGDYPCGLPEGDNEIVHLVRGDLYPQMGACIEGACSAARASECVRTILTCLGE